MTQRRRTEGLVMAALAFLLLMAALYWVSLRGPESPVVAPWPPPVATAPRPAVVERAAAPTVTRRAPIDRAAARTALEEQLAAAPEVDAPTEAEDKDPLQAMTLRVSVVDDQGEPLRRVPVVLTRGAERRPQRYFTGPDGRLEQRVDAGPVVLYAERADGLLMSRSELVEIDGTEGGSWSVELVIASEPKAGLGVNIAMAELGVLVSRVHPGTPADAAGLVPGDIITAIEGEPTQGMAMSDFVTRMTGAPGTRVLFDVLHEDGGEERMQIERQILERN